MLLHAPVFTAPGRVLSVGQDRLRKFPDLIELQGRSMVCAGMKSPVDGLVNSLPVPGRGRSVTRNPILPRFALQACEAGRAKANRYREIQHVTARATPESIGRRLHTHAYDRREDVLLPPPALQFPRVCDRSLRPPRPSQGKANYPTIIQDFRETYDCREYDRTFC